MALIRCQTISRSAENCVCWRGGGSEIKPKEWTEVLTEMPPNCDPNQRCKTFAESQRWLCDVFRRRPVIESGLSASLQRWYFSPLAVARRRGRKGESRRCDGGIMEFFTGQRRTIDLSAGSLCPPAHPPQYPHSSAVHQDPGFLGAGSHCPACLADSVPLSVNGKTSISVTKCHQLKRHGDILNYWLASKQASLTIFFLSAVSPPYRALFFIP